MSTQPEALRLADALWNGQNTTANVCAAVDELRRLHKLNAQMLDALQSAMQTADFENHSFRPWHAKARAAIAAGEQQ